MPSLSVVCRGIKTKCSWSDVVLLSLYRSEDGVSVYARDCVSCCSRSPRCSAYHKEQTFWPEVSVPRCWRGNVHLLDCSFCFFFLNFFWLSLWYLMFLLPLLQVVSISVQSRWAYCKMPEPEPRLANGALLSQNCHCGTVFLRPTESGDDTADKVTVVPVRRNGNFQTPISVPAVRPKRCHTLSNPAHRQDYTVACPNYSLQMMMPLPGWPVMAPNAYDNNNCIPLNNY